MKSMMNDSNTSDDGNNHNWLGFSLSPYQMGEITSESDLSHNPNNHHHYYHHDNQVSSSAVVPSNFYMSPSMCYGVGQNSNSFHSSLSMMPLNSDGSLCIMEEALTRSQSHG
ncbi:ap2-like ethylene-responsive transcription factor ant-like protein [Trifolium pratense]|uniref:Ap2-like ethylene-responsive transcription factor ant-like protein n=1 Tax=Trifolium pratense TaxID=57577 RepID=A0A2K3MAH6_TRIPR|nr:ap2-like ethylene-responsive transcription factor ant-like protein [Trifolium pratense]